MAIKKGNEVATIDVVLVTVKANGSSDELALDTASKIGVSAQTETEDAAKLIIKGKLIAQKPAVTTLTGNTIVLTDNVFNAELVKLLQGGTIVYKTPGDAESGVSSYTPPLAGSGDKGSVFEVNAYSAVYDSAGLVVEYEKITYPNCQGTPVALSSEDGVFRAPEYTINSAPKATEAPYAITYIASLPVVS